MIQIKPANIIDASTAIFHASTALISDLELVNSIHTSLTLVKLNGYTNTRNRTPRFLSIHFRIVDSYLPQTIDIVVLGKYFRNDKTYRQGSNPILCHRRQWIHPRSLIYLARAGRVK